MVQCSVLGCQSDGEKKLPDISFHSMNPKQLESGDNKEKPGFIILKKLPKEKIAQLKNFQQNAITKPKAQLEQVKSIKTALNVMGVNKNMILKPVTDIDKFKNLKNILQNHKELIKLKPNQKFKIIGNVNKSPEKIQNKNVEITVKQENSEQVLNSMPVPFNEAPTNVYYKKTNILAKPTYHCSKCKYASTSEPEMKEHIKKHQSDPANTNKPKTPEKIYTASLKSIRKPFTIKSQPVKNVPEKVSSVSTANLNYALKHESMNELEEVPMDVEEVIEPQVVTTEPILVQGKKLPLKKGLSRQNEISCTKCSFTAKHPLVFKIHMAEKHGDSKEKKQKIKEEKIQKLNDENNWDDFDDFFTTPVSTPPSKLMTSPQKKTEQSHLCFQCGFEAKFADQLRQHEEKEHGADSVSEFRCQYCDWSSRNADKILFHLIHHPDQEVDEKIDTSILKKYGIIKA